MLFDCLADESGADLTRRPLTERRRALEGLHKREATPSVLLSPATYDRTVAQGWLDMAGAALDGIVAKRRDGQYLPGERAMVKVKQLKSADCVVGGFRYATGSREVGSLLLGLYDEEGRLDHVGFTSGIAAADRPALTRKLEALIEPPGFTGDAPGGPSRWSTGRSADWEPLRPELVAEVRYDHVTGRRFRHGTRFLRWRPDKAPEQCRFDQLEPPAPPLELAAELETTR
jgi:ATP-dependent DNA ligase